MAIPKTTLVCGATGKQGEATIRALVSSPHLPSDAKILALTRNTSSLKAKGLLAFDTRVELISGEPITPEAIFASAPSHIDAVYCVTVHGPPGSEEAQAEGLFNASKAHGVSHFVFASADRGGDVLSETNPSPAPHIATKYRIEKYIKAESQGTNMRWTFLRPATFFDNLTNDFNGKSFAAMWHNVGQKPVQMVATSDIGFFAAKVLLVPDEWAGKSIGIAGDEINFEQATQVFKDTMGFDMPHTFNLLGALFTKTIMTDMGSMFKWFEKDGYGVDIQKARELNPGLKNFAAWLEKDSQFEKVVKSEKSVGEKQCNCGSSWCKECRHRTEIKA